MNRGRSRTGPSSGGGPPPLDISALPGLPLERLRELWPLHMGKDPCPGPRRVIVRELAWRHQERLHGGLDAHTRRLLDAAIREARKRRVAPGGSPGGPAKPAPRRASPSATPARRTLERVPEGARLVRAWPPGSKTVHEVTVLDAGKRFRYLDREYASLSEIARLITGTRWSGPRFFGLASRAAAAGGGGP